MPVSLGKQLAIRGEACDLCSMPDRLTPAQRSAHMARITKTDTKPELVVRRLAHGMGYRLDAASRRS
jgi:hypothetical protein